MRKKEGITFALIFCIAILSTIIFLQPHYCVDTIEFMNHGYETYVTNKFLVDGRIFSALLLRIVIDMPMQYVIPIMHIIGIFISCISTMYLRKILLEYKNGNTIIATIISYITIFNFMYIDAFSYVEFPIIAISILLYIIASKLIIKQEKGYLYKSAILVIIAMFCYQGTVCTLIVTTFVLSIIENKNINKGLLLDMFKVIVIFLIAGILNYFFTVIVGGTQRLDFNLIGHMKNAIITIYMLIVNSGNQYIPYLQLIFTIIICIYCLIRKKNILNIIAIYLLSMFVTIIVLVITQERIFSSIMSVGKSIFLNWCTNWIYFYVLMV